MKAALTSDHSFKKADVVAGPIDVPMSMSEESKVKCLNPRVALMEMLNKRQPKIEAISDEEMNDGAVLNPRAAKRPPTLTRQQSASPASSMPLSPIPMSNITLSQPTSPPSSCEKQQLSQESPEVNGFFPATSRHIRNQSKLDDRNQTNREARYENKTSSDARGCREVESISLQSSPLARENETNVLEILSSSNSHDHPSESKCVNSFIKRGKSQSRMDESSTQFGASKCKDLAAEDLSSIAPSASRTKGIAEMAAAAARKKNAKSAALTSPLIVAIQEDLTHLPTEKSLANTSACVTNGDNSSKESGLIQDSTSCTTAQNNAEVSGNGGAELQHCTFTCSACDKRLDKSQFSKNQLAKAKRKEMSRCKNCIAVQRPVQPEPHL